MKLLENEDDRKRISAWTKENQDIVNERFGKDALFMNYDGDSSSCYLTKFGRELWFNHKLPLKNATIYKIEQLLEGEE